MEVDGRIHQGAGHHQPLCGRGPVPGYAYPVVDHPHGGEEAVQVYLAHDHPRVMGVAEEIVHLVRVHRAVYDLVDVILGREMVHRAVEPHHVQVALGALRERYEVADLLRVDAGILQDAADGLRSPADVPVAVQVVLPPAGDEVPRELHVVEPRGLLHDPFQGMGERRMADVMHEGGGPDRVRVLSGQPQRVRHPAGDMISPEAVLETGVVGPGEDIIPQAELPDPPQPLHLAAVEDIQAYSVHVHGPVHGVVDRLHLPVHSPAFQSLSPT